MKIAALGYYGFANLGDEAVLAGIRTALAHEQTFRDAEFLVLSHSPNTTPLLHPGTTAVNRWRWQETATALSHTDLFILGGGSLLQDATSVKSVVWYALMTLVARRKARRVLWWGQGIGPLHSRLSRFLVAMIARTADSITVRDVKSKELLKETGYQGSIELVADPAFALIPKFDSNPSESRLHQPVLIALRSWRGNEWIAQISQGESWDTIVAQCIPAHPRVYVPMHLPDDQEFMAAKPIGCEAMWDWQVQGPIEKTLTQFACASVTIAMRLHALIFAVRCAIPFVALSYDPKVDALATASGQEDALLNVNNGSITREHLQETIDLVQGTNTTRRAILKDFATMQSDRAMRPAKIATELFS